MANGNEIIVGLWGSSLTYLILHGQVLPIPLTYGDGVIEVREIQGVLSGTHRSTGDRLYDITFDGTTLEFYRPDPQNPSLIIFYTGEVRDGELIVGTFEHRGGGPDDGDTGTWGATNPGTSLAREGGAASKKSTRKSRKKG